MSEEKKESVSILKQYKWPLIIAIVLILALIALLIIGVRQRSADEPQNDKTSPISKDINQESPEFAAVGLTLLNNCETVLDYYQENALRKVTAWGLGSRYRHEGPVIDFADTAGVEMSADSAEASTTSEASSKNYSTTNIQVEGVDEADKVKTDGKYIYILSGDKLRIVDVQETSESVPPQIIADLKIDFYASDMLLSLKTETSDDLSDTLILIGRSSDQVRLMQVDIDDRSSPEVTADFAIDGNYVGMRLTNNTVRLITTASPLGFEWDYPKGSGLRAEEKALEANKEIVRNSELNNWVPAYKNNLDKDATVQSLVDCSQMLAPRVFSGFNSLSIMTFNASKQLDPNTWRALGLAAEGQEIYATASSVYVSTTEVVDEEEDEEEGPTVQPQPAGDLETIIHKFGSTEDSTGSTIARPIYLASGKVAGSILNQFSMDEYAGDFRVAVTVRDWDEDLQENHVVILRPREGILEQIGSITGLGVDERIFAVRFMGPQGYVVTFEEIDPLYSLDLSDPTAPKALGELKITGFSSYLHPVGENLLLGIGQEADLEGRIEGLQISLFDTSNPTAPKRVDQGLLTEIIGLDKELGDLESYRTWSSSVAENDHRAFLFYEGIAFIPYSATWYPENSYQRGGSEAGILVIEIQDKELVVKSILKAINKKDSNEERQRYFATNRTVVVGDLIYGLAWQQEIIVWQMSGGDPLHIVSE